MKPNYKSTLHSCYIGYISQAIVNNLAPLLFIIFQTSFSLSYEEVGRLVLINFGTQIAADFIAVKITDRVGYRFCTVWAHLFCTLGLVLLGTLPMLLPSPYFGLVIAVVIYAMGGGFIEVLVSPIVESLPGDAKASAMSLLHSFYCWGQMGVVLISTLVIRLIGNDWWFLLPIVWAVVPFYNMFRFMRIPLIQPEEAEKLMSWKELRKSKMFLLVLLLMMCAGASELTMSQWSSLFAEEGLGVSKVLGDLLGPCLFAVLMGIGRAAYGILGHRIDLKKALTICGGLCVICYAVTIFALLPVFSLLGCAFCGLSVSLMWPGTFSMAAAAFPRGGTVMFGMMAVFGDIGGSVGPWIAGVVSDLAQKTTLAAGLSEQTGQAMAQIGLKCGLLAAIIFPMALLIGVIFFRKEKAIEE
ncbi:MFS transporter [Massiliimalia massiliensis]|uniref:MFS transporter n=1 Tax=Massiliimalia massiliensis TaxID=1852384 RepID=UPI0009850412|nr:MFS transporter [Massiliimalia massiliensis]